MGKGSGKDIQYLLVGMFFLALLIYNYPILMLFGKGKIFGSLPTAWVFIFVSWTLFIGICYLLIDRKSRTR